MEKIALEGGCPVRERRLPIFRLQITAGEMSAVQNVLLSGYISRSSLRDRFAEQFRQYTGARYAVVVSSGTAALHLALRAMDLRPGSEAIVPSFSFVATAFAVEYCGLKPVFAEVDPETFNISPEDIERKITARTEAIIPVHFAGQVADLEAIYGLARRYGLAVVEDAAHAVGAKYGTKKVGASVADTGNQNVTRVEAAVAFSLFATKNMTSGEGGIVTTGSAEVARRIELMRAHGIVRLPDSPPASGYYDVVDLGYNYHLSDPNIALGMERLKRLDELNRTRRERARRLTDLLNGIEGVIVPQVVNDHVFHIYNILLDLKRLSASRDRIVQALLAEGIQVGVYYRPIHLFSYFQRKYGTRKGDLPITEQVSDATVTLPMYPLLSDEDLRDIARAVEKVVHYYRH